MNNGNYCGMEFLFVFWEAFNTQRQKDEFFFGLLFSTVCWHQQIDLDRFLRLVAMD